MSRRVYDCTISAHSTAAVTHVPECPVTFTSLELLDGNLDVWYVTIGNTILPAYRKKRPTCQPNQAITVLLQNPSDAPISAKVAIVTEPIP